MNEIAPAYVYERIVDVAQRTEQQTSILSHAGSIPAVNTIMYDQTLAWLERQPDYWLGRAYARRPQPGCNPLSKDYAHDMMLVGRYEGMAKQLRCE